MMLAGKNINGDTTTALRGRAVSVDCLIYDTLEISRNNSVCRPACHMPHVSDRLLHPNSTAQHVAEMSRILIHLPPEDTNTHVGFVELNSSYTGSQQSSISTTASYRSEPIMIPYKEPLTNSAIPPGPKVTSTSTKRRFDYFLPVDMKPEYRKHEETIPKPVITNKTIITKVPGKCKSTVHVVVQTANFKTRNRRPPWNANTKLRATARSGKPMIRRFVRKVAGDSVPTPSSQKKKRSLRNASKYSHSLRDEYLVLFPAYTYSPTMLQQHANTDQQSVHHLKSLTLRNCCVEIETSPGIHQDNLESENDLSYPRTTEPSIGDIDYTEMFKAVKDDAPVTQTAATTLLGISVFLVDDQLVAEQETPSIKGDSCIVGTPVPLTSRRAINICERCSSEEENKPNTVVEPVTPLRGKWRLFRKLSKISSGEGGRSRSLPPLVAELSTEQKPIPQVSERVPKLPSKRSSSFFRVIQRRLRQLVARKSR